MNRFARDKRAAEVGKDMQLSKAGFENHVWPHIKDLIGADHLEPVEGGNEDATLRLLLDACGVDAFAVFDSYGRKRSYGIASRTWRAFDRYGEGPRIRTGFMVRYRRGNGTATEFQKLHLILIETKKLYYTHPHITVNATFQHETKDAIPLYIAYIDTVDLISYLSENVGSSAVSEVRIGSDRFYFVPCDALRKSGKGESLRELFFDLPGYTSLTVTVEGTAIAVDWMQDSAFAALSALAEDEVRRQARPPGNRHV